MALIDNLPICRLNQEISEPNDGVANYASNWKLDKLEVVIGRWAGRRIAQVREIVEYHEIKYRAIMFFP